MLFSIVTVNYNNLDGLRRTFTSIIDQTFSEFEWIVIDGNSNDGSITFLEQIELPLNSKMKNFIYSEEDEGIYDAMNKGILKCSGYFVLFLNSGDYLFNEDVLLNVAESIGENKSSIFYGGYSYCFPNQIKTIQMKAKDVKYLRHGLPSSHQSIFYPLSFLKKYQYDLGYVVSSDYYLTCLAYLKKVKFVKLSFLISVFEIGGTSSKNYKEAIKEANSIQKSVLNLNKPYRLYSGIRRFVAYNILRILDRL